MHWKTIDYVDICRRRRPFYNDMSTEGMAADDSPIVCLRSSHRIVWSFNAFFSIRMALVPLLDDGLEIGDFHNSFPIPGFNICFFHYNLPLIVFIFMEFWTVNVTCMMIDLLFQIRQFSHNMQIMWISTVFLINLIMLFSCIIPKMFDYTRMCDFWM